MRAIRLRGLIRKEFLQVVRDPSSIAIAFFLPVLLLVLFGYGVSLNAKHVPLAVVAEKPDSLTAGLTASFRHSSFFDLSVYSTMSEAEQALRAHQVQAIVRLRENMAQAFTSQDGAPIQVIVNGSDANTARLILGYIQESIAIWLEHLERAGRVVLPIPVRIEPRIWFNPEVESRHFLVPGLIAVIMTLIGALLTALVMAREWERGTLEALMVTPVTIQEILLGKLLPYFLLGTGGLALSVAMAIWLFQVPFRGSFGVLAGTGALFLLVALGMGLLISVVARNQFIASQVAILATFLPAFILSGFIFDLKSMPAPIQVLTYGVAARYFVEILQTLFLAGTVWDLILPNAMTLVIMALLFLGLSRWKFRKRLD
ncbi:MAG: ABC transporter permease [Nitrospirae bacterium]|nr:MAG: ABC transporter permease [Nitrospirota bacterium]